MSGGETADGAGLLARTLAAVEELSSDALVAARWSGLGGRRVEALELRDAFALGDGGLAILEIGLADDPVPVLLTLPLADGPPWAGLHALATGGPSVLGLLGGRLVGRPGALAAGSGPIAAARPVPGDQSHTSVILDERAMLKLYRRLTPGPNPEAELLAALAGVPDAPTPDWLGSVELELPGLPTTTVAIEQAFVSGAADAFELLANSLAEWLAGEVSETSTEIPAATGRATGRLHAALAGIPGPAFSPRTAAAADRSRWLADAEAAAAAALRALGNVDPGLAGRLERAMPVIRRALRPLGDPAIAVEMQRIHGDLHLGQVLPTARGLFLIDFEGDPMRDPGERRALGAPLRDLAGFLRSIDHVARSGARRAARRGVDPRVATVAVDGWIGAARAAFLDGYAAGLGAVDWIPDRALLRALEVEKELGEFAYAATFLPDWLYAPTGGMRALLGPILDAASI